MSEPSEGEGEFQVLESFEMWKTLDFSEYVSPDENPLIAKIPSQPSTTHTSQEAGDPEKEGGMIVTPGESAPNNSVLQKSPANLLKGCPRQECISVQKKEDVTFCRLSSQIHLLSTIGNR